MWWQTHYIRSVFDNSYQQLRLPKKCLFVSWKSPEVHTHTHTHQHTHRNTVIPNAVILALQVVVAAVDEMAEEPSVDGLCELISVLLWHLHCVASSDHITWHTKKHDNISSGIVKAQHLLADFYRFLVTTEKYSYFFKRNHFPWDSMSKWRQYRAAQYITFASTLQCVHLQY